MAAAVKEAPASPTAVAAKTSVQANALAAMAAASANAPQQKLASAMANNAAKAAAPEAKPEVEVKKEPEVDVEETRFWMKQTVVYVALFATIIAMACGATAAILTGIAGTVVAQLSLPQVVAEQPAVEAPGK
jgi:cytochrome oxidase Cu insertion factor (SCO1/SenC/PrrC family)